MNDRFHGGISYYPTDFSVNLNPLVDESTIKKLVCKYYKKAIHYPEQRGESLLQLIGQKYNLSLDNIVLGNGSIELFYAIPHVVYVKRIVTLEPTFCEYRYIAKINNLGYFPYLFHETFVWDLNKLKRLLRKGDILFICNPNNPTGNVFIREDIIKLLETGAYVVVDEAFMDFSNNDQSLIDSVTEFEKLIVVKSLTKIYSIAGLRVGFCVASKDVIYKLKKILPLWNVNGIAINVAINFLKNVNLVDQTKSYMACERKYIKKSLDKLSLFKVFDTMTNFFLAYSEKTEEFIDFLHSKNVTVRKSVGFYGLDEKYFRFAIKKKLENRLLVKLMGEFEKKVC
jgi:threonine-phosphate decarboxylase